MNDVENNYKRCELCKDLLHIDEMMLVYTMDDSRIWLCKECILCGDVNLIIGMLRNEK